MIKFKKPLLIAEVGLAHDGSLGIAKSFAKTAKENGADAIKFQFHDSKFESSSFEKFRKKFSHQDNSRQEYWDRTSFNFKEWAHLKNYCSKLGLYFVCSPFSVESAELLNKIGIDFWKIASGEFSNLFLIEYIVNKSNKPIILSTGLAYNNEINQVVKFLKRKRKLFYLLQCTSKYPTPLNEVGHSKMNFLKNKYKCKVGLSDHSGNLNSLIASIMLGAEILEFHVTYDKNFFGPDTSSSINFKNLKDLSNFKKDFLSINSKELNNSKNNSLKTKMSKLFKKSLYVKNNLSAGTIIKKDHLVALKPNTGISVIDYRKIIGKKIKKNIKKGKLLKLKDLS